MMSVSVMWKRLIFLFCACLVLSLAQSVPVKLPPNRRAPLPHNVDQELYKRYLEEELRRNPSFQKRVGNVKPEDLLNKLPKFGERLTRNAEEVRSQVNEAQRLNVEELRRLHREKLLGGRQDLFSREGREMRDWGLNAEQIRKGMLERKETLAELDKKRREAFKRFEMQQEHKRRQSLKHMDEKRRLQAEQEFAKRREQLLKHDQLKHPASRLQLEDVWQKQDGFLGDKLEPRTFFYFHDANGDRFLDQMEIEALFQNEVQKLYGDNAINEIEAREEAARMREHAMSEMDLDGDRMVSLDEFLAYTRQKVFDVDDEWKPVVEHPDEVFTEEELADYEADYEEYDYEYDEDGKIVVVESHSPSPSVPSHEPPTPPLQNISDPPSDPSVSKDSPQSPQNPPQNPPNPPHSSPDQKHSEEVVAGEDQAAKSPDN